jgi:hypothetical protein
MVDVLLPEALGEADEPEQPKKNAADDERFCE